MILDAARLSLANLFAPETRGVFWKVLGLTLLALVVIWFGLRETFIAFEPEWGRPDGMTTDAEGHLWIAHWGGGRISRFTPDGKLERSIPLPASQITNVCFAGPALDRMFVTCAAENREQEAAAGSLFEILDHGARGLPPGQFAG